MQRVVISGLGIVSSIGSRLETVTAALRSASTGFRPNPEMLANGLACGVSAPVQEFDPKRLPRSRRRTMSTSAMYAASAGLDAVADAALDLEALDRTRCGVIVGTEFGGINEFGRMHAYLNANKKSRAGAVGVAKYMNSTAAGNLCSLLAFKGRTYSPSSSFSTGPDALGQAYELIGRGVLDLVVCGGTEEECWLQLGPYFENLSLMSPQYNEQPERACRPYDVDRSGMIMSSGSGIVVMESLEHAERRGAAIRAEVVGYGCSNDGDDLFRPSGRGLVRALRQALEQATDKGVERIDYVNTHGTGTHVGDVIECATVREVFGQEPWVSSTKSLSGHAFGAAGAIEIVFTLLMLSEGFVAPTANLESIDPECGGIRHVLSASAGPIDTAVSFNVGLGGTNSALALRRIPSA